MNQEKLRHGQALAIQWVAFALQKLSLDAENNGVVSRSLLGDAKTESGTDGLETLALGCNYVVNFVLPLAIELALKALIGKEKKTPYRTHNLLLLFNNLSLKVRGELERRYHQHSKKSPINNCDCFKHFLSNHKDDFEGWRYLDDAEILKREEIELHYALTAILDVFNGTK